ncbi:MAG: DUF2911 domain-containing protein [Bacteroidota bacterium]
MLKKILIGLGVVVALLVIAFFYLNYQNRKLSPAGKVSMETEDLTIEINYSRPSVRDRLIFGHEEEDALLPYGKYWRLGANEPTDITIEQDFLFDGKAMKAGKYVLYAIPRNGEMELRLNADLRFWGYSEPDYQKDLLTAVVKMESVSKVEEFTIKLEPVKGGANVVFLWDRYQWQVQVLKE